MESILTVVAAAVVATVAAPAIAADCETEVQPRIEAAMTKSPLEAGLTDAVRSLLHQPPYFEDAKLGASCTRPKLDNPLYPGIPVKECSYQHLGLTGWVMVASPSADVAAKWISNACSETADAKTCALRLTAQSWCASHFAFPIAGNLITPVTASDGRTAGVNTPYLHGVAIARPLWLPEKTTVSVETQKQRFSLLAASEKDYDGLVGQVSWPSGLANNVHAKYAAVSVQANKGSSAGAACSALARRPEWISASRASYNQAWRNSRNGMFDVAAKALMAGEPIGSASCKETAP